MWVISTDLAESCLSFDLEKFWRQEEIFDKSTLLLTPEEQECENFFVNTHSRDKNGRYIVRLPFKNSNENLTFRGSFAKAKKMLHRIEDLFNRNAEFSKAYHTFFSDYKDLGHMEEVRNLLSVGLCYYLTHHGFLHAGKFRSVFSGAAKDYNKI